MKKKLLWVDFCVFLFGMVHCYYMKRVNVSTKKIGQFAGKWVAIDPVRETIVAVGETLKEISPLVTRPSNDQRPAGTVSAAFLVLRKDEGQYLAPSPLFVLK